GDGKLVYVPDEQGNTIIDSSHAGYGGGGIAIPTLPVRETIWPAAGDNSENIQAAINKISSRPLDASGFRGAVLLKAGYYRMATPIRIQASGVVLRGEGMGDTGTILVGTGTGRTAGGGANQSTLVSVGGASGTTIKDETRQIVTEDYVPVGARRIQIASARGFKPGDTVIVRRIGNQDWIDAVGMSGPDNASRWRPFNVEWDRIIVDVQGDTITIDAPITCAIEKRWGGAEVIKYEDQGRIERVGVENLRAISEFDPSKRTTQYGNMDRPNYVAEEYYSDEDHYRNFVIFDNTKNGWVRNTTALHFVYSMVGTQRGAKWITVQDCVSRAPVSMRAGARRFTFALRGQLALVQRCLSEEGRHSFMSGQPTSSANVFLDCKAVTPFSSSEPHEQWATGTLFDNVQAPLTARFWKNINIGWAGANTVFWNCEGSFLVQKPPTAQNFSFGHLGVNAVVFNIPLQDPTKENGHIESLDKHVTPRSLYLTQLRERLGDAAVRQVATSAQIG
ncbi:MAG TPA: hypothetical protein VFR18_18355, partial [Terriglobia bacterium]|nr:hypothetical protein [Terriglobia bacterium]